MRRPSTLVLGAVVLAILGCDESEPPELMSPNAGAGTPAISGGTSGAQVAGSAGMTVAAGASGSASPQAGAGAPAVTGGAGAGGATGAGGASVPDAGEGGSGGSAGGIPIGPPPADVSKWDGPGPFTAVEESGSGPSGADSVYRPTELGQNGMRHPIVLWGSGIGQAAAGYRALLMHWATHGFVVITPTGTNPGSGADRLLLAGLDWLIEQDGAGSGPLAGKLDTAHVGAVGHSNGGIAVVLAGVDPRISTVVPIAGGDEKIHMIDRPILLVGFADDFLVNPHNLLAPQYETVSNAGVLAVLNNAGHGEAMGDGGRMRGYVTAWIAHQLWHDPEASGVFYGPDCTICSDSNWVVERKNVPGVEPIVVSEAQCMAEAFVPAGVPADCKACLCAECPVQAVNCEQPCWSMATCMVQTCGTDDLGSYACASGTCGGNLDGYRYTAAMSGRAAGCLAPGACLATCFP